MAAGEGGQPALGHALRLVDVGQVAAVLEVFDPLP
jgi:hypothetical protein